MGYIPLIASGISAIAGLRGHEDWNPSGLINAYQSARPEGYITDSEYGVANRQRNRAGQIAGQRAALGKQGATWRFGAAAGGGFAPSLARQTSRIDAQEGAASEDANNAESDLLSRDLEGNKAFQRHQLDTAFGANLGASRANYQGRQDANAGFWNSMGDIASLAANHFGGKSLTGQDVVNRAGGNSSFSTDGASLGLRSGSGFGGGESDWSSSGAGW